MYKIDRQKRIEKLKDMYLNGYNCIIYDDDDRPHFFKLSEVYDTKEEYFIFYNFHSLIDFLIEDCYL